MSKSLEDPAVQAVRLGEEFPVLVYTLKGGEWWLLYAKDVVQLSEASGPLTLQETYRELRRAWGWLDANPKRRKTRTGMPRFLHNWLARSQT